VVKGEGGHARRRGQLHQGLLQQQGGFGRRGGEVGRGARLATRGIGLRDGGEGEPHPRVPDEKEGTIRGEYSILCPNLSFL